LTLLKGERPYGMVGSNVVADVVHNDMARNAISRKKITNAFMAG